MTASNRCVHLTELKPSAPRPSESGPGHQPSLYPGPSRVRVCAEAAAPALQRRTRIRVTDSDRRPCRGVRHRVTEPADPSHGPTQARAGLRLGVHLGGLRLGAPANKSRSGSGTRRRRWGAPGPVRADRGCVSDCVSDCVQERLRVRLRMRPRGGRVPRRERRRKWLPVSRLKLPCLTRSPSPSLSACPSQ